MRVAVCLFVGSLAVSAATIPFQGVVAGNITILSPGPVIENEARGVAAVDPFGPGEYFKHGLMDFTTADLDGASTGTGTFELAFADGSFYGTYIEKAFPPDTAGRISFSHMYTITGGTGLFEGASGSIAHPPTTTTLEDLTFSFDLSGVVSAPRLQAIPEPSTALPVFACLAVVCVRRLLSARV
jgi:hypothetical protein